MADLRKQFGGDCHRGGFVEVHLHVTQPVKRRRVKVFGVSRNHGKRVRSAFLGREIEAAMEKRDEGMRRLLTVTEVAERLNCSQSHVYGLLASGELRHYVVGRGQGGKRVSEEQLADYLQAREKGGRVDSTHPIPRPHQGRRFEFLPPSETD